MKVVLLCAGYATRLYPLTENQPKPLLPVGGKPILEHLLEQLKVLPSIQQVFVVTNDRFFSHFQNWAVKKRYPWKVEVVNDGTKTNEERLGAIGDLALVLRQFRIRDDLAVFAGDNLFGSDLKGFISFAHSHRPHTSIGVVDVGQRERARQYGIVRVDSGNRIVEFLEKPHDPPSTLASTGAYWFDRKNRDLLDRYIREDHNADRPGDYIRWLVEVDRVFAYPFKGSWFDIGSLDSYQEADRFLTKRTPKKGERKATHEK